MDTPQQQTPAIQWTIPKDESECPTPSSPKTIVHNRNNIAWHTIISGNRMKYQGLLPKGIGS